MAKVKLTGETITLDAEAIDALKTYAVKTDDGEFILDTDKLKTAAEVETVLRSKRNADEELKGVKQQLTEAQGKLKTYTDVFGDGDPAMLNAELVELRKGSEGIQTRLIEATQSAKAWEKKYNDQQPEFLKFKEAAEKQAERERLDHIDRIWAKKREALDPKWNKNKADLLFQDIKSRIKIDKDDPEDFERMENGMSFEDYVNSRLDLYGAYADMSGGKGRPGNGTPENGGGAKDMFSAAAAQIQL